MASRTAAGKQRQAAEPTTPEVTGELEVDDEVPESGRLPPIRIGVLDVLRVLGGLFLLSSVLSYFITNDSILWGYRPGFTRLAWLKARLVCFENPHRVLSSLGMTDDAAYRPERVNCAHGSGAQPLQR
jgi:hypothetical protein